MITNIILSCSLLCLSIFIHTKLIDWFVEKNTISSGIVFTFGLIFLFSTTSILFYNHTINTIPTITQLTDIHYYEQYETIHTSSEKPEIYVNQKYIKLKDENNLYTDTDNIHVDTKEM